MATIDLPRTITVINGNFSQKSQIIPTPMYFVPLLKGFPSELGIGAGGQKTRMMGLPGQTKSLTISSAVFGHQPTAKTGLTHSAYT